MKKAGLRPTEAREKAGRKAGGGNLVRHRHGGAIHQGAPANPQAPRDRKSAEKSARVKTDALARLGELLRDMPKAKGTRTTGGNWRSGGTVAEPPEHSRTLSDLGISKKVSSVAQQLAALPADVREEIAAGEMTVTTSAQRHEFERGGKYF